MRGARKRSVFDPRHPRWGLEMFDAIRSDDWIADRRAARDQAERDRANARLARWAAGGQSGGKRVGLFWDGPPVLEAWGENALCLSDRDAGGSERLLKLP